MKNFILIILYIVACVFALFILGLIFDWNPLNVKLEDKASLLSAIGIIISAYVASLSVMISIDNSKNIENEKQKNEFNSELDMLKLKTAILKHFLSIYFADKSHYKEALKKSNISEDCMHSRDDSYELLVKLDNYEQFIDAKIKVVLSDQNILETLQDIIRNISIVRSEEKFKKDPPQKGFTVTAQVHKALIHDLGKLEEYLENSLAYYSVQKKDQK